MRIPVRKCLVLLLCAVLLTGLVSCALAQSVPCPEAHLTLTVPDSWKLVPLTPADDPDLCLSLKDKNISLSVYVVDAGGLLPDAFQVFTGDETESGTVTFGKKEMSFVAGNNDDGDYRIYTWLDRRNQVQFYFLITGHQKASRKTIEEIMKSLDFD